MFYEFFQKILRTLFAFNFYVFSKLTFDIDVINDKRIVLLTNKLTLGMRKNFRVPFCLKLSKASYANFRKSILDREWIVIKITFNLLKSSKSKNHRIKEFYFHEDEPVALTIFSSRGSAVSIDLESRLTHSLVLFSAKQQWQGYFFFLFFFLLARDRPPTHVLIKALCSEPNYHPTSNSNLLFTWTPSSLR